ncbi:MAG: hypothetical protein ACLSGW_13610 [Clostridium sp.]
MSIDYFVFHDSHIPRAEKEPVFPTAFSNRIKKRRYWKSSFFQQPPKTGSAFLCIFVTQTLIGNILQVIIGLLLKT